MKFQSEYADTADELLQLKDRAFESVSEKKKRLQLVRDFTNMKDTMTEAEANELGITEITNHGQTYRAMSANQSQYQSMVTRTNALLDLKVDTDNPEVDETLSMRINNAINRHAIHNKGKFSRFWGQVGGELTIAGGGPVTQNEKYGWLPQLRQDMFFPSECSLEPEEIPYAFDPKELTLKDLENLLASVKSSDGIYIDKSALKDLIEEIKAFVKDGVTGFTSYRHETSHSTREDRHVKNTIPAWWFYEIKYDDNGDQYVSSTLFVDANTRIEKKNDLSSTYIIAYYDKAFSSPVDWIHYPYVDSEIGGVKNMDTVRGIAEIQYNSALDMEELLNLIIEGEKIRARPKFRATDQGQVDKILKWDMLRDTFAPAGIEELVLRNGPNGLQGPLALLSNNAAGLANVGPQGESGQLRVEALNNQQQTMVLQNNKVTEAYNHLDTILEMVVWRILAGPIKPGTEGYHDIKAVRDELDKYGIDYKKLAERKNGRFVWLRVKARRVIGNGDRTEDYATSDWLMENVAQFSPQTRPLIQKQAVMLRTKDPDFADAVVKVPQSIINAQKITAENEADTIRRRAPLGQILPTNADDIHQDHIPIHMLDMQALVAKDQMRPWDKLDMLEFAALAMHCQEHIRILLENPVTNGEAKSYMQDFQNISQAGQRVVQELQKREGSEQNQLTAKEQADLQIKWADLELKARKQGMDLANLESIFKERESRSMLNRRAQLTGEIQTHRKLELEQEKINEQGKDTEAT